MKLFLLLISFVFLSLFSNAQYRTYKNNYTAKSYSYVLGDRYKPATAAALAIIPGVGHLYINQPLRGLIFPAGMVLSSYLMVSGSWSNWAAGWNDGDKPGNVLVAIGLVGFFGFYVWNFIDVIHKAKIKNLYFRDFPVSLNVKPFFQSNFQNNPYSNTAGVTLKVSF